MPTILDRQLKRAGLTAQSLPADLEAWSGFLRSIGQTYEQADQDRYLLERSLSLSSAEMSELHSQLAAERDSINTVICSLVEGVCAIDSSGVVLFINPAARRLLRVSDDSSIQGMRLEEFVHARTPDGRSLTEALATAEGDATAGEERRLIVADDESEFITFTVSPLGREVSGVVLTLRDVTKDKRLEKERSDLNRRLIEVSRQAGMAEVASNVLHNVGNVLNSVNISASLVHDTVKASRCAAISRIGVLLDENRHRLGEFLTQDPAGAKIPEYIAQLGGLLEGERDRALSELVSLRNSVDHIREIVAAQQSYAKVGGTRELEDLAALAEEAIRVVEASMARHGVRIIREFQPTPPLLVERNQVLQVLVNILANAKQAIVDKQGDGPREITIQIGPGDEGAAVARIIDSGCGIPPENLTRIFSHGFTTRPAGHGFGLHSAAIAAKAMGGSLTAESAGVGLGACFIFRIPTNCSSSDKAA